MKRDGAMDNDQVHHAYLSPEWFASQAASGSCAMCGLSSLEAESKLHQGWETWHREYFVRDDVSIEALEAGSKGCHIYTLVFEAVVTWRAENLQDSPIVGVSFQINYYSRHGSRMAVTLYDHDSLHASQGDFVVLDIFRMKGK